MTINSKPSEQNKPSFANKENQSRNSDSKDHKADESKNKQQAVLSDVTLEGNATVKFGDVSQSIKNEYNNYYGQEEGNFSQRKDLSDYESPYFPEFRL